MEEAAALRFAEGLASACFRLVGDLLVSVVLHGSLTSGDYRPRRSDVDVLIIVRRPLSDAEATSLEDLAVGATPLDTGLDFRVVLQAVASSPTESPRMEVGVERHPPAAPGIRRHATERDLVAELSLARATGRPLLGADPAACIGIVPDTWVVSYGDEHLARWQQLTDDDEHAELMTLTACRVLRFAREGVHCSKTEAGRWALMRHPELRAIDAALRLRDGEEARVEPADLGQLLELVRSRL